jgi:hypothetical protein
VQFSIVGLKYVCCWHFILQEVVGSGQDDLDQDKKLHNAFGGDQFMELKYKMMKKIEAASEVLIPLIFSVCGRLWFFIAWI